MQQRSLTRLALDQQLQLQYNSVTAALDYEGRTAMAVSSTIAALPPVKEAIVTGERDALMALLGGVNDVLKQQGIRYVNVTLSPATIFLRVHDPKVFGDDVSARRTAIVQANKTGKAIVGVEQGRDILNIYAMTPILQDGQSLAVIDIGIPLGPEFVNRAKQRFGVDLAVHSFDGKAFNTTASTFGDAVVATPDELKSALDGQPVRRDAVLNGRSSALYLGQIKNSAGQPVAVLELIKDTSEYETAAASAQLDLVIGTAATLAIAVFLALLLGRGLSRPVTALTGTMNRLSSGDTDVVIPGSERLDELGTMAKAVDVFRRGMIEARALRDSQEAIKQQAELEKHKALHVMADTFEATIGKVIETVTSAATELQAASGQMAGTAAEASSQATSVATSAQLASSNVQTVASATEQLAASIQEIAQQVERSQIVSSRADEEAVNTTGHIQALSDDVGKIGEIVNLINTIAGQTNLLALNATIEAARAGDAGKGFAVVAGEVKNLANQTGRATSEISSRILAVQQSTDRAVQAVHSISKVISEMGGISTAVAAAVEEQSSATSEISRNVEQAAGGTEQVSRNIVSVEQAARDTGMAAQQIKESSLDLSKQAEFLRQAVDQFLAEVRADRQA